MSLETTSAILGIAAAITLGAMLPGPSFILVTRTSLALSRKDGLAAAVGMGIGAVLFAVVALLGLLALLAAVPRLYIALKLAGGLYLAWVGFRLWRAAKEPLVVTDAGSAPAHSLWRSFFLGLTTQLSNPKTAVIYASVFASLLPDEIPWTMSLGLPVMVFAIEAGWYAVVALALSAPIPHRRYVAAKAVLDRAAGGLLVALGTRLAVTSADV